MAKSSHFGCVTLNPHAFPMGCRERVLLESQFRWFYVDRSATLSNDRLDVYGVCPEFDLAPNGGDIAYYEGIFDLKFDGELTIKFRRVA